MCPKIHTEKKEYESPEEVQVLKILISTGDSYFKIQSLKVGINRQPLFISIDGEQQNHINGGIQSISDIVSSRITEMRRGICYTLHGVHFLNPFVIIVLNILYSSIITVNFHYI